MFCNVGLLVFRTASLKPMLALVGHRFDVDTPIAETVREFMSEVDGIIC